MTASPPTSPHSATPAGSRLTPDRRREDLAAAADHQVDVLVVGLGVTGAGVALDAAARGLSVVAVDSHDLGFGTSRWSSKLVHGGLRYLANAQVGVAMESARERHTLLTRTAPHLTRAIPMLIPLTGDVSHTQAFIARQGLRAGDLLRRAAGTPTALLPSSRRLSTEATILAAPSVQQRNLRGGLLSYDGQLVDDARLVTAIARTAAAHGARVLTHTRASEVSGTGATLRDELTGESFTVRARAVVNAAGVWAGEVVPGLSLRPSRGTHVVVRADRLPGLDVALSAPVPGTVNRFVFTLPQQGAGSEGLVYLGLTDEPIDGEIPDVPEHEDHEIDFLLETINSALSVPLTRDDVVGTYSGLRPLLEAEGTTSDLSRHHAVLTSESGVVTVVGGKLTTYRKMAEDAVDAAVGRLANQGVTAGPSRTADLPLVGAAPRAQLAAVAAPQRLVQLYGAEAPAVLAHAIAQTGRSAEELLAPIAAGTAVTRAELLWGASHEGALTVEDLLDRRTRLGLVPRDRAAAVPAAEEALAAVG